MTRGQIRKVKTALSNYLSERSVVRHYQYPTRANTVKSVGYLIVSLPLALLILPLAVVRAIVKGSWRIHVLATEGEFGPFVKLMEVLRSESEYRSANDLVVVLSRRRHALCDLYESELGLRVLAGNSFRIFVQQAILLQPPPLIRVRRLTERVSPKLSTNRIRLTDEHLKQRHKLFCKIGVEEWKLVVMAVYVREYEEENNPQYLEKMLPLISIGNELAPAVDFLEQNGVQLLMVGSTDSGLSKIPRTFARLSEYGQLGGQEEVLFTSACRYFWTDNVGAWWLAVPFQRPVLQTNYARLKSRRMGFPAGSLCLPTLYQKPDGTHLTLREVLTAKTAPYKAASRGDLRLIRNSPAEIINAHQEMLGRLDGSWLETDDEKLLALRSDEIMKEFPDLEQIKIATSFLTKHPSFLD